MRYNLFIIWDRKAECATGPVITVRHEAEATRAFTQITLDPQTTIGQNPEDFELVRLGTMDDAIPELKPEETVTVLTALEVIALANKKA